MFFQLSHYFWLWYLHVGLESIIENMVLGGGAPCLAKVKNSSWFMYTKFYWPYFTIIQKWLSIDYKTWIKNESTSNYCNNLNLKMLTWMLYRSQDLPLGKLFCPFHSVYFREVILQQFYQKTDGDNIFVCFSHESAFEHACFGQVLLYFQLVDLLTKAI